MTADCGCTERHDHEEGCDMNHYPHDACGRDDDPTQHDADARRAARMARHEPGCTTMPHSGPCAPEVDRLTDPHDCEPNADGTACQHCGLPAERADLSPDALVLLAAYASADHEGIRARVDFIRADVMRHDMIRRAQLTDDDLATAAARFGIVPDGDRLPLNTSPRSLIVIADEAHPDPDTDAIVRARMSAEARDRMRETGDVWAGIVRGIAIAHGTAPDWTSSHGANRYYEQSDGWEEREFVAGRSIPGRPLTIAQRVALTAWHTHGATVAALAHPIGARQLD